MMTCMRSSVGTTVKDSPYDFGGCGVQRSRLVFSYEGHSRFGDVSVTLGSLFRFYELAILESIQAVDERVFHERSARDSLGDLKLVAPFHQVVVDNCWRLSGGIDLVQILQNNDVYLSHPERPPTSWHLVNKLISMILSMVVIVDKWSELTKFLVHTYQTLIIHPSKDCVNDYRDVFGCPQKVGIRAGVATPDPVVAQKRMLTNALTDLKNTVRNDDTIGNDCPNCGDQITAISTRGPQQHFASPCNCQISAVEVNDL